MEVLQTLRDDILQGHTCIADIFWANQTTHPREKQCVQPGDAELSVCVEEDSSFTPAANFFAVIAARHQTSHEHVVEQMGLPARSRPLDFYDISLVERPVV